MSKCSPTELAGPLGVGRLRFLRRLPQHEVERILLAVEDGHPLAGTQLVDRLAGQLAVAGELAHREVDVAVGRAVGQPLALQRGNELEHLRHVAGGRRFVRGPRDAERIEVGVHRPGHLLGELADGHAALERAADDLVVDVGDVADVGDLVAQRLQPAVDDVEGQLRARVAHVAQVVDRDAADVHAHMARLDRLEFFCLAGQRVVDAQGHETVGPATGPWMNVATSRGSRILGKRALPPEIPGRREAVQRWACSTIDSV
jgi:hypothetical protein